MNFNEDDDIYRLPSLDLKQGQEGKSATTFKEFLDKFFKQEVSEGVSLI